MPRMTGKQALVEMLLAEGVDYIFGNPGTSETPLLDALQDYLQLQYVLALQEATVVGMADGYARATGRPAFANIHIAGGLANSISGLYNAFKGGTPLVLTAGNTDTRMLLTEPALSGDLVQMATQYTKWSAEILHAADIPMAVRRAFKVAKTPPTGPVFLSFPWNTMDEEVDVAIVPSAPGYFRVRPDRAAVERAAELLLQAQNPMIVVGDRVAQSGAVHEMVRVAELVGARVAAASFSEVNFPTSHSLYRSRLNLFNSMNPEKQFADVDVLLAVGTNVFSTFFYVPQPLLAPTTRLIHLDNHPWEIEKIYPTEVGMLADPKAGLAELAEALEAGMTPAARDRAAERTAALTAERRQMDRAYQERLRAVWDHRPMAPERMMHELAQALPANAIIADESITVRSVLFQSISFDEPGSFFGVRGGAIGWGLPGALGVQLAHPDRPVIAVVGDGSSMYTIQALWTAARYNIPVTYVICNNRTYKVLKINMEVYLRRMLKDLERESRYMGMDLDHPLDLAALARSMGVAGETITNPADLGPALTRAVESGQPALLDVVIDGSL